MIKQSLKDILKVVRLPPFRNRQSARCPVVSQPYLAALYSEVVGGDDSKKFFFWKCVNDTVMSEKNSNRTKWMHLRLKPEEYAKIQKQFSKSTCRKLSDYARKILLDKACYSNLSQSVFGWLYDRDDDA